VKEPEGDLIVATHGRSFWILDDLSAVRAVDAASPEQVAILVRPRPAVRFAVDSGFSGKPLPGKNYRMPGTTMVTYRQVEDPRTGEKVDQLLDAAKNPPDGALIYFWLKEKPQGDITLTFLETDGREIRTLSSHDPTEGAETHEEKEKLAKKHPDPRIPKEAGLNRFVWNLRYPDATKLEDDDVANELAESGISGPVGPPGSYRVRLTVGEQMFEQDFEVRKDPRLRIEDAELHEQFELLQRVHTRLSETHRAINELRAMRRRAEDWAARTEDKPELDAVRKAALEVVERLKPIEAELIQVDIKAKGEQLNFPIRLNGKLAALSGVIATGDGRPTRSQSD